MDKLTDEQINRMPERAIINYENVQLSFDEEVKAEILYLCAELARALAPQPQCGHPGACVVSAPSAKGFDTTNHCGWCENLGNAHAVWIKHARKKKEKEHAALRAKLEAAKETVKNCAVNLDQFRHECNDLRDNLAMAEDRAVDLERHNAYLRLRLSAAQGLAEALEATEWVDGWCPRCDSKRTSGHAPDCQRQQALAAWEKANEPVPEND